MPAGICHSWEPLTCSMVRAGIFVPLSLLSHWINGRRERANCARKNHLSPADSAQDRKAGAIWHLSAALDLSLMKNNDRGIVLAWF